MVLALLVVGLCQSSHGAAAPPFDAGSSSSLPVPTNATTAQHVEASQLSGGSGSSSRKSSSLPRVSHGGAFASAATPAAPTATSRSSTTAAFAHTNENSISNSALSSSSSTVSDTPAVSDNQKQQLQDHSFAYPTDESATHHLHRNGQTIPTHSNPESHSRSPAEIDEAIAHLTEKKGRPLKVLFLSADTGGGHRASAESLAKSFQNHYPGTTYDLLDVWTDHGVWPYYNLVPSYKHLSAHPRQWGLFYHLSNNYLYEVAYDQHSWLTCERRIRRRIREYNPDVVVSVHPTMNNVPLIATRKIGKKDGRHIPFFTVVTDFGSAHTTWFQKNVEKIFVASDRFA